MFSFRSTDRSIAALPVFAYAKSFDTHASMYQDRRSHGRVMALEGRVDVGLWYDA
jgi:hypothetical protein